MNIEISGITGGTIIFIFVGFAIFLILLLMLVPRPRSTKGHNRKTLSDFLNRLR